jgi:hypothetical protein
MFNHDVPHVHGHHPKYGHLIYVEVDPHHGSYIVTSPAAPGESALVSEDDVIAMDDGLLDREYGYVPDDYLAIFE